MGSTDAARTAGAAAASNPTMNSTAMGATRATRGVHEPREHAVNEPTRVVNPRVGRGEIEPRDNGLVGAGRKRRDERLQGAYAQRTDEYQGHRHGDLQDSRGRRDGLGGQHNRHRTTGLGRRCRQDGTELPFDGVEILLG